MPLHFAKNIAVPLRAGRPPLTGLYSQHGSKRLMRMFAASTPVSRIVSEHMLPE